MNTPLRPPQKKIHSFTYINILVYIDMMSFHMTILGILKDDIDGYWPKKSKHKHVHVYL